MAYIFLTQKLFPAKQSHRNITYQIISHFVTIKHWFKRRPSLLDISLEIKFASRPVDSPPLSFE